jgi:hypothetical protein
MDGVKQYVFRVAGVLGAVEGDKNDGSGIHEDLDRGAAGIIEGVAWVAGGEVLIPQKARARGVTTLRCSYGCRQMYATVVSVSKLFSAAK